MPEQQAFCVFVRLMETYEMRTMFTLNMEGLQLRLYQFSSLLSQMLPELSDHLAYHGVHPPMYASQWFLTLFAYAFPIPLVLRIYDVVFAEGAAETIMRVAIAILQRSEDAIMQLTEFEDILDHVTTKLHQGNNDASQMINDAMQLSGQITREKMDHLAQEYMRELENDKKQADQVLAIRFNFWSRSSNKKKNNVTKRRASSTSSGSSTSSNYASPITLQPTQQVEQPQHHLSPHEDTAALHQQIEELLLTLSQTQSEHLQVKQELVQVRMDKMDIEAELDALRMTVMDMEGDPRVELAKLKAAHFELQQQNEELRHEKQMAKDAQNQLVEKIVNMEIRMNDMKQQHEEKTHEYERRLDQSIADERCRELEGLLAEAKLKIAELETCGATVTRHNIKSTNPNSKRKSLDPVALAHHKTTTTATTTTGGNKRSSFYGRLWSSVTSSSNTPPQDTPPTSPI